MVRTLTTNLPLPGLQLTALRSLASALEGMAAWTARAWAQLATALAVLGAMACLAPLAAGAAGVAWASHFTLKQVRRVGAAGRGGGGLPLGRPCAPWRPPAVAGWGRRLQARVPARAAVVGWRRRMHAWC